jgi:hypothetical protein
MKRDASDDFLLILAAFWILTCQPGAARAEDVLFTKLTSGPLASFSVLLR